MHIALSGPIAGADIAPLVGRSAGELPQGCHGAPLMVQLVQELLARGHRVSALTLSADLPLEHRAAQAFEQGALRLVFCPMRRRAWRFNGLRVGRIVDLFRFERQGLQRQLAAAAPDLVHAHWSYEFAWAALDSGLPHVVTCHDCPQQVLRLQAGWQHRAYRGLRARMARRVLARAQVVSAVSPYLVQQVQSMCAAPVALVPNPVPALALAIQRHHEPGRARLLVVANGFSRLKNTAAALRAAASVASRHARVELVLLGADHGPGGEAEAWWRAQPPSPLAPIFAGPCTQAEVLEWMARSDVLLHPALEESFGLVLAEAMAIGLPVVAGAGSGAVPWVTGGAARLVDVNDEQALADAVLGLLQQPAAAHALAERARAQVLARFAPSIAVDGYEALYRQARLARERAAC